MDSQTPVRRGPLNKRYKNVIAKRFDVGVTGFTHQRQVKQLKALLAIANSQSRISSVLDCPCGSGRIAVDLVDEYDVTCADLRESRVAIAKRFLPANIRFDICSIFDLPYDDRSFDAVVSFLLVQHIAKNDLPGMFEEISRVTRRWAVVTYSSAHSLLAVGRRLLRPVRTHALSQKDFEKAAASANLKVRARRFVLPGVAETVVVLLEK